MSFLRRLFGAESADELVAEAEKQLAAGDLGGAKISFERAKEREKDEARKRAIEARIDECLDALAAVRLDEAERLMRLGENALAMPEVEGAIDIAKDEAVRARAERLLETLSRVPRPVEHAPAKEPSRADRIAMLIGRWTKDEDAELDPLGEPYLDALLALDEGLAEEGAKALELIVKGMEAPRHVMRPLARARRAVGDMDGAVSAIEAYLTLDAITSEDILASYAELASIAAERRDVEGAIAAYERCIEALDDDPRPCLLLGQYLRLEGRPAEAVEVLEIATSMMTERDFQVVLELALCRHALGEDDHAVALFEEVLAHFRTRGRLEIPEDAAIPLAMIYEKRERIDRAADLMRVLAEHGPHIRRAIYGLEAARLVTALGLSDEARRLLRRARAATEDEALRTRADDALRALEST